MGGMQVQEVIALDMEETNELLFKVKVEGTDVAPARVRMVCEAGDMSYMFHGSGTEDEGVVQFVIPPMQNKIGEGQYQSRIEVLIENRYFSPVQFNIDFKKPVKVMAESLSNTVTKKANQISVSAEPVIATTTRQLVPDRVAEAPRPAKIMSDRPAPIKKPTEKEPPPRMQAAPPTLRERHERKVKQARKVSKVTDERTLRQLARSIVSETMDKKKRGKR
jgi:hypothetical protein